MDATVCWQHDGMQREATSRRMVPECCCAGTGCGGFWLLERHALRRLEVFVQDDVGHGHVLMVSHLVPVFIGHALCIPAVVTDI